jgi:hypothetical protein
MQQLLLQKGQQDSYDHQNAAAAVRRGPFARI